MNGVALQRQDLGSRIGFSSRDSLSFSSAIEGPMNAQLEAINNNSHNIDSLADLI